MKKNSQNSSDPGGYLTTEAAMIVPLIIILYCILIYLCFYQYDRCLLAQDSYLVCLEISGRKENREQAHAALNRAKYFMLSDLQEAVRIDGRQVNMEGNAGILPQVFTEHSMMPENWRMSFSAAAAANDPPKDVRLYRRVRWILKKGYEFLTKDEEKENE